MNNFQTSPRPQPKHSSRILSRNSRIREDYRELRQKGFKNWEVFVQLSEKYFLSENTIDKIIYTKSETVN